MFEFYLENILEDVKKINRQKADEYLTQIKRLSNTIRKSLDD